GFRSCAPDRSVGSDGSVRLARQTRPLLIAAALLFVPSAVRAHPVDNANLPPTKARPDLRHAELAGGIAQALLVHEGRYACCIHPGCGMCRQNGAACPCAENALAGKGVCGECWEGWQAGKGGLPGIDATRVKLGTYPGKDPAILPGLPPTRATNLLA